MARSTFPSQKCKKLTGSEHFLKLRCRKSACRYGAKHISKSKCAKHTRFGPRLEVEMSKKCTPLWREAHFECKKLRESEHFWTFRRRFAWQAQGIVDRGLCSISKKTVAGVGHLKGICKDAFSMAGAEETCSSELLGGPGADFLREAAFWSIRSSGLLK